MSQNRKPIIAVDDAGVWVTCRSAPPDGGIGFIGVWLVFWAVGELAVLAGLFFGHDGGKGFMLVWLLGWTLGGAIAWYSFLWPRIGVMVLQIDSQKVSIRNALGPLVQKREFVSGSVRKLRVSKGSIAFESDGQELTYGEALDHDDLAEIVAAIRQKYPEICGEPHGRKKGHAGG